MTSQDIVNYNAFKTSYNEKKYELAMENFFKINLEPMIQKNFIATTHLIIFKNLVQQHRSTDSKYVIAVLNGFKLYFKKLERTKDYGNYISTLNLFTYEKDLEKKKSVITELKDANFSFSGWLHDITEGLFKIFNGIHSIDKNERRKLYLSLSQALLFYVNMETQRFLSVQYGKLDLKETKYFLKHCTNLACLRNGVSDEYVKSFELLNDLITSLCNKSKIYMAECVTKLTKYMEEATLSATLIQDNYLTFAKIITIFQSQLLKTINGNNCALVLNMLHKICFILPQIKTDKDFCHMQCMSSNVHSLTDLAEVTNKIFQMAIENDWNNVSEDYCSITLLNWKSITSIKCKNIKFLQYNAFQQFLQTLSVGGNPTKQKSNRLISILIKLLRKFERIQFCDEYSLNKMFLLRQLYAQSKIAEDWDRMTSAGYAVIIMDENTEKNEKKRVQREQEIIYSIAKMQKDSNGKIQLKTPHEYFTDRGQFDIGEYKIELPKDFNHLDVSVVYLKYGNQYGVLDLVTNNKIVHQMLMPNKKFNPVKHLRIFYFIQTITLDKISLDRLQTYLKQLKAEYSKEQDVKKKLLIAAVDYHLHQQSLYEWNKENLNLSIVKELEEERLASDSSIFRHITLEHEREIIKTLRFIRRAFIDFVEFFMAQSEDEQKNYADEKGYLLCTIGKLAGEFAVRDYQNDIMELYVSLFKLSKLTGDEFGIIDSCSYFAENSKSFKLLNQKEKFNLNTIIQDCYAIVISKLNDIDSISQRRKNQIFCFLLNLVIYNLEENQLYKANMILLYVFKTNDCISNEAVELTLGKVNSIGEPPKDRPIISSNVIRIKFYSVLFQLITKYEKPSVYPPLNFIRFSLLEVQKNVDMVSCPKYTVPLIIYKMIAEMVMWCQYRYETSDTMRKLLRFITKFACQNGFARRSSESLLSMLLVNLYEENIEACELKFKAIGIMSQIDSNNHALNYDDLTEAKANDSDGTNKLKVLAKDCPKKTSPKQCLSPNRVIKNSISSKLAHYLQDHSEDCKCPICKSSQQKYFLFETACTYARYAYLKNTPEFDIRVKRSIFTELYDYWYKNRKNTQKFPRSDRFYLNSARMLMWCAHFEWKYEKKYDRAKEILTVALRGLENVKRCDYAFKRDLKAQVISLEHCIRTANIPRDQLWPGVHVMNAKKDFNKKEPNAMLSTKKIKQTMQPPVLPVRINLFQMIESDQEPVKFEIHDDEQAFETPSIKRSTRAKRCVETPTITPSARRKLTTTDSVKKTAEKKRERPK